MLYCCAAWAPVLYCAGRAPEKGAVYCGAGAGMVITQSAGKYLPCHTAYTLRAAGEPDVLPDGVVCAGDALFLAAAGVVVIPSCSRG